MDSAQLEAFHKALHKEHGEMAGGMMNAMAFLGTMICASGNITKSEFLELSRRIARQARDAGEVRTAQLLEGMCSRIEVMAGHLEQPPPRQTQ